MEGNQVLFVIAHVGKQRLRFARIVIFREAQQLVCALQENLLIAQVLDQLGDKLGNRTQQRAQPGRSPHDVKALGGNLRNWDRGQRLVKHIGQKFGLLFGDRSGRVDELTLDDGRIGDNDDDIGVLVDRYKLKLPDGYTR